ncbi:helix-turn-helix domain-containing protein [Gemmata sp.]|uniref:helix-turn-helix domain-containing protein n=1 Tax=Gemmata sp. TaxID=1914242 RepID=UPI003F718959
MGRPRTVYTPVDTGPTPEAVALDVVAEGVLGVAAAGKFCAHSRRWVYERIAAGEVESFKLFGKRVIPVKSLRAFLARHMLADLQSPPQLVGPGRGRHAGCKAA